MRNLQVIETAHGALREFNHLRISNLEEFFKSYPNNVELYRSPFEILADLEKKIKYENRPEESILIPYKDEGDFIFDLVEIKEEGHLRIVFYEYAATIS